jgi:hypothetical protein
LETLNSLIKLALAVAFGYVAFLAISKKNGKQSETQAIFMPSIVNPVIMKAETSVDFLKVDDASRKNYEVFNGKPLATEPTICCVGRVDEVSRKWVDEIERDERLFI